MLVPKLKAINEKIANYIEDEKEKDELFDKVHKHININQEDTNRDSMILMGEADDIEELMEKDGHIMGFNNNNFMNPKKSTLK